MSQPFRDRIRAALSDENLQIVLDNFAARQKAHRDEAITNLSDPIETLQRQAHILRAHTIAHLDQYLSQFTAKLEQNGLHVHIAKDAAQALVIAQEIIRAAAKNGIIRSETPLIAKSKTMVSQEIGFNAAMQAAGMRVVETDLGEYIVQLRGEHPSHIVAPAMHLSRQQVSQDFNREFGLPLTDSIPVLTNAARKALREIFLNAEVGVSGVNFGVAETGTLCIITNEGNGRMVTTLPPLQIALMGMERIVPGMSDLAEMLALLPRSATGQALTVYTQLIHGPRRSDEVDGSIERHVILLDNGRLALRGTPLEEMLLCIRCGACINACPVFREIGGHAYVGKRGELTPYPGPMGSVISPGLFGMQAFGHLAQASTLCGVCKEVCPVEIDLPKMLLHVRAGQAAAPVGGRLTPTPAGVGLKPSLRLGLRGFAWFAARPARFRLAQKAAALIGKLIPSNNGWLKPPAFTGWGLGKDLPRPAARTFSQRFRDLSSASPVSQALPSQPAHPNLEKSVTPQKELSDPIRRFEKALATLEADFRRCTQAELPDLILTLLAERSISRMMAWEADALPDGLSQALEEGGIEIVTQPDAALRAGLTGASAAIAETGTLVLAAGVGKPLTASLLPNLHIAVIPESAVANTLTEALTRPEISQASSVTLVSGPSRTADIEQTLTLGVHGPEEVVVFCYS